MKTHQENGWEVTSPVYIGSEQDIRQSQNCPHPAFRELLRAIENGLEMVQEQCTSCVAVRMKSRKANAGGLGQAK